MSTLVDGLRSIYDAVAEDTIARLEADNRALRASWDELQRDNLRLTDECDKLKATVEQSDRDYVAVKAERDAAEAERDRMTDDLAVEKDAHIILGRRILAAEAERDVFRAHSIDLIADCYAADGKIEALTAERDRLRQALTEIRTYALSPSLDPDVSASDRHIAGMVDAALAPLPSAGEEANHEDV